MRLKSSTLTFAVLLCTWLGASAESPKVSFSGYLDADVWTDLAGSYFTNEELDLGMSVAFGEKVSANVYVTAVAGAIPAGGGRPGDRWASLAFDGFDITFESGIGTFSVGDLVYQYGCFNYYFYKRLSMITGESFTRGLSYSFEAGALSQTIMLGAADNADTIGIIEHTVPTAGDSIVVETEGDPYAQNAVDIIGASDLTITDGHLLSLYYGTRFDVVAPFAESGTVFAGLEYNGEFGDVLAVKADVGYQNFGGETNTFALLLEPTLSFGDFSVAASYYQFIDPDETGANFVGDELYAYVEPGYAFSEKFAFGLPLELHTAMPEDPTNDTLAFADKSAFWAVPTAYIYPADGVQWWLWAQVVVPFAEESDLGYGLGSEIIVEF